MNDLTYLACPYNHTDPAVRQARFEAINRVASILMRRDYCIISPISHTHPIALAGRLPVGWDYWESYDKLLIDACKRVIVCQLDGWRESRGVQSEIVYARSIGIPVYYCDAHVLYIERNADAYQTKNQL